MVSQLINIKRVFWLCFLLSQVLFLHAWEGGSRDIYFKIVGAKNTEPPFIMENKLILLYRPEEPTRFVGAAFAHEDFVTIHPFKINEYDVFYLVLPLPEGISSLQYRLIIDGLWTADPSNKLAIRDQTGISLSLFPVPETETRDLSSPQIRAGRQVTFIFRGKSGERVYLCGSFNHWNPYLHQMKETPAGSGIYEITLPFTRGTYYYNFLYQGDIFTDPQNVQLAVDNHGKEVSVLSLP